MFDKITILVGSKRGESFGQVISLFLLLKFILSGMTMFFVKNRGNEISFLHDSIPELLGFRQVFEFLSSLLLTSPY